MKKLALLFGLMALVGVAYASEQVYFKIAVNENDYSTFLTDRISTKKTTLQYLATKMRQPFFNPERLNKKYYNIKVSRGIKYFDKDVVQYDITPIFADRFRHVLMVDEIGGVVIRKEIYDTDGKLVFAFTSLDRVAQEDRPELTKVSVGSTEASYKGYYLISDRKLKDGTKHIVFTDGLNRFSIFRQKSDIELISEKRILYGNYIYRERVGKELFTVVGTLPFEEMERLIKNIVKLEEKPK